MSLLDADVLMTDVRNTITEQSRAFDWINLINRQPTAYYVDKVVAELEKKRDKLSEEGCCLSAKQIKDAIKIVKAGGNS